MGVALFAFLIATLLIGAPSARAAEQLSRTAFLTWVDDPARSVVVQWLSETADAPEVRIARPDSAAVRTVGGSVVPFGPSGLSVARVAIDALEPDTVYEIRRADVRDPLRFRTAALNPTRLSFAVGGDAGPSEASRRVCTQAARRSPLFAVIGGDIAYGNGRDPQKWIDFLRLWNETMVTPDGLSIPLLVSIGNHEVDGKKPFGREAAPFFYALFPQFAERGYTTIEFGGFASFLFLDSQHTTPIGGEQAEWIDRELAKRRNVPHLFAVYHVPAFPSVRSFSSVASARVREFWVPRFDRFGVDTVFENHDHAYKRARRVGDSKVLFLGDGAWGATRRTVKDPERYDYLASAVSANHFIHTEITDSDRWHLAIDSRGRVIDSVPEVPLEVSIVDPPSVLLGEEFHPVGVPLSTEVRCAPMKFLGRPIQSIEGALSRRDRDRRTEVVGRFKLEPGATTTIAVPFRQLGSAAIDVTGVVRLDDGRQFEMGLSDVAEVTVVDPKPRPAVTVPNAEPGLEVFEYHGRWRRVPDFRALRESARHDARDLSLSVATRRDEFALSFTGYLRVDESGAHRFVLRCADGATLRLHDTLVTVLDGRRGKPDVVSAVILLEAGFHPFRLDYFDAGGEEVLELLHQGPNAKRPAPIDSNRFVR
ncbi:MAG: PA14 domain-containing protein [Planctomycetota bacterium]